ncbi:MAG: ribosome-binding factor A [Parcubacteria group bacterium]
MRRMIQINELIQHALAQIFITDVEVPREFFITVTKIDCASNLKTARAFVSVLPFNKSDEALKFLINSRHEIQKFLGRRINLQFTPILRFSIDDTGETADNIYTTLDKIKE